MQTIYRVENSEGVGPYAGYAYNDDWDDLCEAHNDSRHPGPLPGNDGECESWPDIGRARTWLYLRKVVFGFASLELLREWFSDSLQSLPQQGYVISEYNIPERDCLLGEKQAMFIKGNQTPVNTHAFDF